jgi:hypothetical protein
MRLRPGIGLFLNFLLLAACQRANSTVSSDENTLDQSTPMGAVEAVLAAARLGKTDHLMQLRHPNLPQDQDVSRICELTDSTVLTSGFQHNFRHAEVFEPCQITDQAQITVLFGPDVEKCGVFTVRQIEGKWYLTALD